MKTKEQVEKMLQQYMMTSEMNKRNEKDELWRINLAKAKVCELILEMDYKFMITHRRQRNHDKRVRMMKMRWEKTNDGK